MSMGPCCATGSLHTGTPTGRTEKVHGQDCYIAEPPSGTPKGVVVIIPDAFGWTLPNNRILADAYAKEGNFRVYLPELMEGVVVPLEALYSMKALTTGGLWNLFSKIGHFFFVARHMVPFLYYNRPSVAGPRVYAFVKALKQHEARDLPLGAAGFCWGGFFVTRLCWDQDENKTSEGKRVVDAGFTAHPSFLTYPQDMEMVVLPLSVAAAEIDPQMSPTAAQQTRQTLEAKTAKAKDRGVEHEFVMYEGVNHGFAVRADEDDKHEAAAGEKAEKQAVDWFTRWFADPPPLV